MSEFSAGSRVVLIKNVRDGFNTFAKEGDNGLICRADDKHYYVAIEGSSGTVLRLTEDYFKIRAEVSDDQD